MTAGPALRPTPGHRLWHRFGRVSFGTILATVVLASLIPVVTLLVTIHVLRMQQMEHQQKAILRQIDAVLASSMGARLAGAEASVTSLIGEGYADPAVFVARGMSLLDQHQQWQRLLLASPDGSPIAVIARQGVAVTSLAPSPRLRQPALSDPKAQILRPSVTVDGDIDVDVGAPIMHDGIVTGALWLRTALLPATGAGRLTAPFRNSDVVLVGPDGRVILSQRGAIRAETIPVAADAGDEPALHSWQSPEWGELEVAAVHLPGAPWSVAAIAATESVNEFSDADPSTLALILAAVLLPILAAGIVARLLQQNMADVATAAHALTVAVPPTPSRTGVTEIDTIHDALVAAGQVFAERTSDRERLHAAELAVIRSQRAQAISLLMAAVAHDFGNLAFAISAQLERLRQGEADEASRVTTIETVIGLSRAAGRMVSDLAQAARLPAPETSPISVDAVIAESFDLLRRAAGRRIEIRHLRAPRTWLANLNPLMMRSALFNLVANAAAAMPNGGPISIRTRNTAITDDNPWKLAPGDYIQLTVSDAGDGMPPETAEMVFDPFFTTRNVGEGNGLGLATVREFVVQAQGAIRVESQPGAGTTFELMFPRWRGLTGNVSPRTGNI